MSQLKDMRTAYKTALDAEGGIGAKVHDHAPEAIVAPCVVIQAGTPFLTDAEAGVDSYKVNWSISIIADNANNVQATEQLEDITEAVIARIDVAEVSAPFPFTYNGVNYLAVTATTQDHLTLGG